MRYDKRSCAHALRMLRDKSGPITVRQETVEDAVLAAELLRRDARIDPNRIFIVGHSMGAMLAPRIHTEGGNFADAIGEAGLLPETECRLLTLGLAGGSGERAAEEVARRLEREAEDAMETEEKINE